MAECSRITAHRRHEVSLMRGLCWFALLVASRAEARVVRLTVEHRESAVWAGERPALPGNMSA